MGTPSRWLGLVLSLPSDNPPARMRVWRALRSLGCGVLRDGLYLLPEGERAAAVFAGLVGDAQQAGGTGQVVWIEPRTPEQAAAWAALFDRSARYGDLLARVQALRLEQAAGHPPESRLLRRLRRQLEGIRATDHLPGPSAAQAEAALAELERSVQPAAARAASGDIRRLDAARFRHHLWAGRRQPGLASLACAWLISRFIDPEARFVWLERPADCPAQAVGFDFDGARFTPVGERVTFEVLMASFSLESDPVLVAIGNLVHVLAVGGAPVAEARGVGTVLAGLGQRIGDDDALFAAAAQVFDGLYAGQRLALRGGAGAASE